MDGPSRGYEVFQSSGSTVQRVRGASLLRIDLPDLKGG